MPRVDRREFLQAAAGASAALLGGGAVGADTTLPVAAASANDQMPCDPPGPVILPFQGGGACPVQYDLELGTWSYYTRYRYGWLWVYGAEKEVLELTDGDELLLEQRLGDRYDGYWNARETTVYLGMLSEAIRAGSLEGLVLPTKDAVRHHAYYQLGPQPTYVVGLICGVHKLPPPWPENAPRNRHNRKRRRRQGIHDHSIRCFAYVAAQDIQQWIAEHPAEHEALRQLFPRSWEYSQRELEG